MTNLVDKYYRGFEGQREIQIIIEIKNNRQIVLRIWAGFFENIMSAIEQQSVGWTSLAYYYNLDIGWYEDSPWKIKDLDEAKEQLESIDISKLGIEDKEVLEEMLKIFKEAIAMRYDILIAED